MKIELMKIELLNSATDGHKEVMASGIKSSGAYVTGNPGYSTYDGVGTRVTTSAKTGAWDRSDATPMTRTDGYGTAEKKPARTCRY